MLFKTLLDEAIYVLSFHNKNSHAPIQTLARLVHGNPKRLDKRAIEFSLEGLVAKEEKWPVEKLKPLTCHERSTPVNRSEPVILFKENGLFFLVDGNNRINLLYQENATELQRVIILEHV